jgi:hypothetical protein
MTEQPKGTDAYWIESPWRRENGIWCARVVRYGTKRWFSLRTRDEAKAKADVARQQKKIIEWGPL